MDSRHAAEISRAPGAPATYNPDRDDHAELSDASEAAGPDSALATRHSADPNAALARAPGRPDRARASARSADPALSHHSDLGVSRRLIDAVGSERFAQWFGTPDALRVHAGNLVVRVADRPTASLLERRFGQTLRDAASAEVGPGAGLLIEVVEPSAAATPSTAATNAPAPALRSTTTSKSRTATSAPSTTPKTLGFLPSNRYRLDSFVVGESNRLAYNAALSAAAAPSAHASSPHAASHTPTKPASPLFIHGPCGVGKTHLLHAVASRFQELHPGATVRVTSGEQFMNDFVAAIRDGAPTTPNGRSSAAGKSGQAPSGSGVERFRRAYRKVDLLCIDDVHFLASKQATQAELVNTFDEIERGGARLVLVSDEHPRKLSRFSPALVSRFMAGLVAGVATPDRELRTRIIKTIAHNRGLLMDDAAVEALVDHTAPPPPAHVAHTASNGASSAPATTSVREIEGLLTRIEAVHRLMPVPSGSGGASNPHTITAALVQRALGNSAGNAGTSEEYHDHSAAALRPVRVQEIIAHTCSALSVETADLSGSTRHARVVLARAVITHLCRTLTTMSYPEIARAIGRPNHSTVITAHQRLTKQLAADAPLTLSLPNAPEATTPTALIRHLTRAIQRRKDIGTRTSA